MTTEKAIYQLTDLIKDRESFCHRDDFDDMFLQDIEALKVGISALEKQVPKKLKHKAETFVIQDYEYEDDYISCPFCDKFLGVNYNNDIEKHKHCPDCGQALDWSDENAET